MENEDTAEIQTVLKVADIIGALMEFWGFKRAVGRMWTLLYLSTEPLSAADIGEKLSMSTGAVSMTLAELLKWAAVKKTWIPGERRDFYEAETSIWKMMTRVLRERELTLVRDAAEVVREAERTLSSLIAHAKTPEQRARLTFMLQRVGRLSLLAQVGESLLLAIIQGQSFDPTEVREIASSNK